MRKTLRSLLLFASVPLLVLFAIILFQFRRHDDDPYYQPRDGGLRPLPLPPSLPLSPSPSSPRSPAPVSPIARTPRSREGWIIRAKSPNALKSPMSVYSYARFLHAELLSGVRMHFMSTCTLQTMAFGVCEHAMQPQRPY